MYIYRSLFDLPACPSHHTPSLFYKLTLRPFATALMSATTYVLPSVLPSAGRPARHYAPLASTWQNDIVDEYYAGAHGEGMSTVRPLLASR